MTIIAVVMLAALIILEKSGKLKRGNRIGGALMMIGSSFACGLYGFDITRTVISSVAKLFGFEDAEFIRSLSVKSGAGLVLKYVMLFLMFVPITAGALYILVRFVKDPLGQGSREGGEYYSSKCALQTAWLSIAASAVMLTGGVISLLLTIPYWGELRMSLQLLNPALLVFLLIFTGGLGLVFIPIFFVVINIHLLSILTFGMIFVTMLYGYSAIFGIASAVRACRTGRAEKKEAAVCGLLSLLPVWSIVPMIYLKKKLEV